MHEASIRTLRVMPRILFYPTAMTALNKGGAIDLIMMGFLIGGIANGEVCSGITVFRS